MGEKFIVLSRPTDRYVGKCEKCPRPVSAEIQGMGDHARITCPDCGGTVPAQRIYGTVSRMTCDPRCMGATGPICECACGGANHGGTWCQEGTMLADELKVYRDHLDAVEAKRESRAQAERKRAVSALESWRSGHAELAAYLATEPSEFGFMWDMWSTLHQGKPLSERQTEVAERIIRQAAERAEREAKERANAQPVPTGKALTVTGEVVSTRIDDNLYGPGAVYKMLVKGDGWKVWATIPREIMPQRGLDELKGQHVTFTADVAESRNDPSFGIAKRPRKASIVQPV